jgi:hypothetical protein
MKKSFIIINKSNTSIEISKYDLQLNHEVSKVAVTDP